VRIELIDPTDEAAFRAWFDVSDICYTERWPGESGWLFGEARASALNPDSAHRLEQLAVLAGDEVIGSARLELPLRDNTHLAQFSVDVHPAHRRRGAGSALFTELERRAVAAGRSLAVIDLDEPAREAGASAGRAFLAGRGYTCAQVYHRRDLQLPLDDARLAALEASCAPHATGYRLVGWRDRCPDEFVDSRAELGRRMSTDAPMGDLEVEEEQWDADRVREAEALFAKQNRSYLATGAVHEATGRLVAFTEIAVPLGLPQRVYQWDTLVLKEHRGHRLGTLIKIANHRALAAAFPQATAVSTWNAEENAPMVAVNEALGFVPVGMFSSWQRSL
jgi:GNAT superfamily N-acetyltransferase